MYSPPCYTHDDDDDDDDADNDVLITVGKIIITLTAVSSQMHN